MTKILYDRFSLNFGGNDIRRFINIRPIYKNGSFFEYKITFEGFHKQNFQFVTNVVSSSVTGIRSHGDVCEMVGHFECGYHNDGNVFLKHINGLKSNSQISKMKGLAIADIKNPFGFLRVAGILKSHLSLVSGNQISNDILLSGFNKKRLSCDIFLSRSEIWQLKTGGLYKNPREFRYFDEKEKLTLHLLFYEADFLKEDKPFIALVNNNTKTQRC
ncbi:MAG: hypothetical protein Q7S34_01945 [bacterium]|nr:hypothetical protein [bacterium]